MTLKDAVAGGQASRWLVPYRKAAGFPASGAAEAQTRAMGLGRVLDSDVLNRINQNAKIC